jgi:hypothetical protein
MASFRKILLFIPLLGLAGCLPPDGKMVWKDYSSQEFGITLSSPFPVTFQVKEDKSGGKSAIKTLNGDAKNQTSPFVDFITAFLQHGHGGKTRLPIFQMTIISFILSENAEFGKERAVKASDNAFEELRKNEKYHNFQYRNEPAECSKLPAIHVTGSFDIRAEVAIDTMHIQKILVPNKNRFWEVLVVYQDKDKYDGVVERIFQSVRLSPPGP